MRPNPARSTATPLPLQPVRSAPRERPGREGHLRLDGQALERFNQALHSIHPDAPPLDRARLRVLAGWLLDLEPAHARRELHQRLARLRELRRMADDVHWDTDPDQHARLQRLLHYGEQHEDLFTSLQPGATPPQIGRLDDALLVELAWPAFADELEDYLDYCRFRHEQLPPGAPALKRSAWLQMRQHDGALWQQMGRVQEWRGAELGPAPEMRVT